MNATATMTDVPSKVTARRLAIFLVGGALISKILGLIREILVAHAIGASMIADSFRGGLTTVLLPLAFIQNESVPAILIPAYREWQAEGQAPRRFAALTVALMLIATALFLLVEASAPLWIEVLLGGFSPEARTLTLSFTRVMAIAMPGSVLLCCLSATEIARGYSRITSVRSTLVNVAVIGGVGLLLVTGRAIDLAWAFGLAFNAVAVWALWVTLREGALDFTGLSLASIWEATRTYFSRLRPLILQPIAEHSQIWIERLLASALAVGTIASLDYARTLSDCAVLLVSQPLGLAVLSVGPSQNLRAQMDALARPILAVTIPASVFVVLFAPEIVTLVFHRGAFDTVAIEMTSSVLRGIAAGLWATTLGWILVRVLNGLGRNRKATAIVATAYLANALVSAILVRTLGEFALGFGEAIRGVVLLTGVVIALGCGWHLLRLMLMLLPGTVALIGLELVVRAEFANLWPRLLLGSALTALVAIVSLWAIVPTVRHRLGAALGRAG